jgi:hypothetical protein
MQHRGPPKKRKKIIKPSCESSIVPVGLTPKTMNFSPKYVSVHLYSGFFQRHIAFHSFLILHLYYSQTTSVSLGSRNSLRYMSYSLLTHIIMLGKFFIRT